MINSTNNKKGSAIITAVGMGTVLLIIIAAVFSFSQYRTQTVIQESKKVKALALAEAGLEVAIGELYNNSVFATHEVTINQSEKRLDWSKEVNWENKLEENSNNKYHKSNHGFKIDSDSGTGTLSGKLGDGEFKVKVGSIPYDDDEKTATIDESKAYVKIESMGIYDNTVRRVIAIVNRRYPTREFLMYDGGVLSLIYGQTTGGGYNVFSTGHLYGHKGIEISKVMNTRHNNQTDNGTDQRLDNITAILSGDGGIFFYSPIKAKFPGSTDWLEIPTNSNFPLGNSGYTNSETEEFGEFPESLRDTIPPIPDNLSKWIKDKKSGVKIEPRNPAFDTYKKQAKFNTGSYECKYRIHTGWSGSGDSLDAVYLDFGNNIRDGNVKESDFPSNGIIYSDKNIVIKGNPPKDVSIVSEKNVFVAGDFNQKGFKEDINQRYGFPQNYESGKNALTAYNYSETSKNLFKDDKDAAKTGGARHHVAATVIAKERVVYDYRSPVDCFENELVPYMKYELAKAINTGSSDPKDCLSPSSCQGLVIKASDTYDGFKESIASFTNKFNIGENNSKSDELCESLKSSYEECDGSFNYDKLDKMTIKVWEAYVNDFNSDTKGQPSSSGMEMKQGVNALLLGLRNEMCGNPMGSSEFTDKADDYLYYPELTTNGMFVSCGKQANTFYAGPDVKKYYNEIGRSSLTSGFIPAWYDDTKGFLHRVFGSETYTRNEDVRKLSSISEPKNNDYIPPTRRKIYDDTLPFLNDYSNDPLELTGFIVMSWQDLGASPEDYDNF